MPTVHDITTPYQGVMVGLLMFVAFVQLRFGYRLQKLTSFIIISGIAYNYPIVRLWLLKLLGWCAAIITGGFIIGFVLFFIFQRYFWYWGGSREAYLWLDEDL